MDGTGPGSCVIRGIEPASSVIKLRARHRVKERNIACHSSIHNKQIFSCYAAPA
jgi:hypothetical protein